MKNFFYFIVLITALLLSNFSVLLAENMGTIQVSGIGKDTYYVYNSDGTCIFSSKTNKAVDVESGEYTLKLNNSSQTTSVQSGKKVTIHSGVLHVKGVGKANFYVYDLDGNTLAGTRINNELEFFSGEYLVNVNNSKESAYVKSSEKKTLQTGSLSVEGIGKANFYVYDLDGNTLAGTRINNELEFFPGEYLVNVNNTKESSYVKASEKKILQTGSLSVEGVGKANFYVYDLDGNTLAGTRINNELEFFPGEYLVNVNNSKESAYVKSNEKEILQTGSLSVEGVGNANFYVYDLEGKTLAGTRINNELEFFPGEYLVNVNNTKKTANVKSNEKETLQTGSLSVVGIGKANFYVYDLEGNTLAGTRVNNELEFFPGKYVVNVNNSQESTNITAGKKQILETGSIYVSGSIQGTFVVYSTTGETLVSSRTNNELEFFPNRYEVKLNELSHIVFVKAGQKSIIDFETRTPVLTGCLNHKTEPVKDGKAMLIQSGEIFQSVPLDINGCYKFYQLNEKIPYSVMIRIKND